MQHFLTMTPFKLPDRYIPITAAGCAVLFLTHRAMAVTGGFELTVHVITNGATKTAARIRHVRFPHIDVLFMLLENRGTERSKNDLSVPSLKRKICF
jgi:hypothetical protein